MTFLLVGGFRKNGNILNDFFHNLFLPNSIMSVFSCNLICRMCVNRLSMKVSPKYAIETASHSAVAVGINQTSRHHRGQSVALDQSRSVILKETINIKFHEFFPL